MSDVIVNGDVDRGWAWVVMVGAALSLAIQDAFLVSVGIFQVEFLEAFSGSQGFVALICAFCVGGQVIFGPVAGVMADLYGHRFTVMSGAMLKSVAMLCASFSTDLPTLLLLYGVLTGVGAGLCYTPSVTVVSMYFHERRTVANGLTLAAPGAGLLLGPYLLRWLIDSYGWRYAMAIFAGLMAQICVLGALFFPLNSTQQLSIETCCPFIHTKTPSRDEKDSTQPASTPRHTSGSSRHTPDPAVTLMSRSKKKVAARSRTEVQVLLDPGSEELGQKTTAGTQDVESGVEEKSRTDLEVKEKSRTDLEVAENSRTGLEVKENSRTDIEIKETSRTDLEVTEKSRTDLEVKTGSRASLEVIMADKVLCRAGSRTSLHVSEFSSVVLNRSVECIRDPGIPSTAQLSFRQRLSRLLCQREIWILCSNQLLMMSGHAINVVLFAAFAQSVGAAFSDIPALYTVYGVTISVGRIAGGFVFSAIPRHLTHAFFGLQVALACVYALLPVYGASLPGLFAYSVMVGLTYGPSYLMLSPILLRYVPLADLSIAFGLVMLCCGAAFLTAPTIAGITYDLTQSYSASYYIAGSTVGTGALLLLFLLLPRNGLQPSGVKDNAGVKLLSTNEKNRNNIAPPLSQDAANEISDCLGTKNRRTNKMPCDIELEQATTN